jgi:hypothetical protein
MYDHSKIELSHYFYSLSMVVEEDSYLYQPEFTNYYTQLYYHQR